MLILKLLIDNVSSVRRLIIAFLFFFLLSACASSKTNKPIEKKQEVNRFENLLIFNDYNEHAFVYYQYCLKKTEPIDKKFLENMVYTANLLLDAAIEEWGWGREYSREIILERRSNIQEKLGGYYYRESCFSSEGRDAKANYAVISKMTKEMIRERVDN